MRGPARATGICHHRDADLVDLMDALARAEVWLQVRGLAAARRELAEGGVRTAWGALFLIYPSLPQNDDLNLVSAAATVLDGRRGGSAEFGERRCCWAIGIGPASNSACKVLALRRADGVGVGTR